MGEVSGWEGENGRMRREGEKLGEGEETGEGKEREGKGFAGPMSKYFLHVYAPVSDCMGSPVTCSYVYVYLLGRSYSRRTTVKRSNFCRRFEKPDLNFQNVYTHSQS